MTAMTATYTARCTCGAVTLESPRPPILQLTCHCQQCRTASKAPFTNFAFFKVSDAVVSGETQAANFVADSGNATTRESCPRCGTLMFDRTAGFPRIVGVVAERLQPPFQFEPRCHVWHENRAADVALAEGVACYERGMP